MHKVQLNDRLYKEAKRRASEAGFASVDEFVAERLENDFAVGNGEQPDLDHLFPPGRIAHIERAEEDIKAGKGLTADQAKAELDRRRAEWMRKNPG